MNAQQNTVSRSSNGDSPRFIEAARLLTDARVLDSISQISEHLKDHGR